MPNRVMLRLFFIGLLGLILAALIIIASKCALAPSSEMKSLLWLPRSLAYWADLQPTFRNFPAFGLISFFAIFFALRIITIFFSRNKVDSEKTAIVGVREAFGGCRQTRRC